MATFTKFTNIKQLMETTNIIIIIIINQISIKTTYLDNYMPVSYNKTSPQNKTLPTVTL